MAPEIPFSAAAAMSFALAALQSVAGVADRCRGLGQGFVFGLGWDGRQFLNRIAGRYTERDHCLMQRGTVFEIGFAVCGVAHRRSLSINHEVIAMHHLISATVAEQGFDFTGFMASN